MKVAAVQLNSGEDKLTNISVALNYIENAAKKGADLIILPEYVDYLGEDSNRLKISENIPGYTSEVFSEKAKDLGVYLHCGSIMEKSDDNKIYNTSLLFNTNGEIIAKYRKIHLYDAQLDNKVIETESNYIKAGNDIVTAETEFGTVGLTICYDIRFPELFRSLVLKGAKIIFVPASFPFYTGASHWEVLLRARAIENQCYIVAAAQVGTAKPNRTLYGNSMIIDPWGTVISRASEHEDIVMGEIDGAYLNELRRNLPNLENRRPETYQL